jgi:hypothetical protein
LSPTSVLPASTTTQTVLPAPESTTSSIYSPIAQSTPEEVAFIDSVSSAVPPPFFHRRNKDLIKLVRESQRNGIKKQTNDKGKRIFKDKRNLGIKILEALANSSLKIWYTYISQDF